MKLETIEKQCNDIVGFVCSLYLLFCRVLIISMKQKKTVAIKTKWHVTIRTRKVSCIMATTIVWCLHIMSGIVNISIGILDDAINYHATSN